MRIFSDRKQRTIDYILFIYGGKCRTWALSGIGTLGDKSVFRGCRCVSLLKLNYLNICPSHKWNRTKKTINVFANGYTCS